jgi:hypothetical protein
MPRSLAKEAFPNKKPGDGFNGVNILFFVIYKPFFYD